MKAFRKARNKKGKRTYKSGRTYFCRLCGYYSWLDKVYGVLHNMRNESENTAKAIGRTCNTCRADRHA